MENFDEQYADMKEVDRRAGLDDPPPKACVLCGTAPQAIGLHCHNCYNDPADEEEQ